MFNMRNADSDRLKAAVLPGTILYAGMAFLIISNSYPLVAALPAAVVAIAAATLVQPLIARYCEARGAKNQITAAYRPSFLRSYLSGRWLIGAFMFNYLAVLLASAGFAFLVVNAIVAFA
jgi:hypothetical protein